MGIRIIMPVAGSGKNGLHRGESMNMRVAHFMLIVGGSEFFFCIQSCNLLFSLGSVRIQ